MAGFSNRYVAGILTSSLLFSCSGSGPQRQAPLPRAPVPVSSKATPPKRPAKKPPESQPSSPSAQPPPSPKLSAKPQPSPEATTKEPPSFRPAPAVPLSASDQRMISKIEKEVQTQTAIATQDPGQSYLENVLRSQQATRLVKGRFTLNLEELEADLPKQTGDYQLQVLEANAQKAIVVAIATQNGSFSYTGAVYSQPASLPVSSICKSNEPTKTPPAAPKLVGANIVCARGSTATH